MCIIDTFNMEQCYKTPKENIQYKYVLLKEPLTKQHKIKKKLQTK